MGTEDGSHLEERYPGLSYKQVQPGDPLPFRDAEFDVVFSNAVLEHVGSRSAQAAFVRELCRVGKAFFITTPNRWFPIEHHTGLPMLHYLPAPVVPVAAAPHPLQALGRGNESEHPHSSRVAQAVSGCGGSRSPFGSSLRTGVKSCRLREKPRVSGGKRNDRPFRWSGKRVLITGGSSGIGKHLAANLARQGAHVAIVADDPKKLLDAESELKQLSPAVWSHPCDIAVLDDIRTMARAYREKFGAPDVLVNNAGYAVYYTFEQTPLEEVQRLFQVNLVGAALITREFLPDMIAAGGGDVVMVASIAGRIPMTPCGAYSASKHGLVALAELLRIETARFNVRVQVVCPGRVETDFFSHESFRQRAPAARIHPHDHAGGCYAEHSRCGRA